MENQDTLFTLIRPFELEPGRYDGEEIVIIRRDGDVWVNPKYSLTEAARIFWDAVRQTNPISDSKSSG